MQFGYRPGDDLIDWTRFDTLGDVSGHLTINASYNLVAPEGLPRADAVATGAASRRGGICDLAALISLSKMVWVVSPLLRWCGCPSPSG